MDNFHKTTGIFLITYHVILAIVLPFYFIYCPLNWHLVLFSGILLFCSGISITAGYHRLWAHQTYKTHPIVEGILLFFATMATQGSALRWSCNHRRHHAHVDTEDDPHNIREGFWHAHFLWLLKKNKPIQESIVSDLLKNPMIVFQHKHYEVLMVGSNAIVFLFTGWLFNDYIGAFVITWWLRLFLSHHFTWFVNSITHTWGAKPYGREQTAVDNFFISLVTYGEGYHNYHHAFARDYRNGIRWFHYDPSKWLIWTLSKLGLASGLKRVSQCRIELRKVREQKDELMERLSQSLADGKESMEQRIDQLSQHLNKHIKEMGKLMELKEECKRKGREGKARLHELKGEIKAYKKALKEDWKAWKELAKSVHQLELQPA